MGRGHEIPVIFLLFIRSCGNSGKKAHIQFLRLARGICMKMLSILFSLSILASFQALAADSTSLRACKSEEVKELIDDQNDEMKMKNSYMVNAKGDIVGVYSWAEGEVHAEVCEYINSDLTIASEWFYWQNDDASSNPAKWSKGELYEIAQDEGLAHLTVVKASKKGEVSVRFEIIGWNGDGQELTVKSEVLGFKPLL